MLHLLYKLADSDVDEQRRGVGRGRGVLTIPPRVFTEPAAGLSGIDRVGREKQSALRAPVARAEEGSDANGGARSVGMERHRRGRVRGLSEVTERALLRGILYAFQVFGEFVKFEAVLSCTVCFFVSVCFSGVVEGFAEPESVQWDSLCLYVLYRTLLYSTLRECVV